MIKLTQTVKKGGCAAKVPALILKEILSGVKFPPVIEGVLIDGKDFDDAAIFTITDELSLVQTLDFFTPIVNSAFDFGAIATANALSDVYAMGGRPKTCMAILAAPLGILEPVVIQEVLQGASDVMAEAKASLVGGHSIDDDTLKFGLSVTGIVNTKRIWSNAGAQVGDVLILTKALGTGTICAALKKEAYGEAEFQEAINSMKSLNNIIDYLDDSQISAIHAATDVTGFGMAGHGLQLAKASKVTLSIKHSQLPLFKLSYTSLRDGHMTKAHRTNREYTASSLNFSNVDSLEQEIYFDPQTSGGLLLSVRADAAQSIIESLNRNFSHTCVIGSVMKQDEYYVRVD
jgi:selenide,water dikinase